MKKYKKPQLVAKNNPTGSFAAGCPSSGHSNGQHPRTCIRCEVTT